MRKAVLQCLVLITLLGAEAVLAQFWGGGEFHRPEYDTARTAREVPSHSADTPSWTNAPGFGRDVFTFVRIRRDRSPYSSRRGRAGSWWTDFPDSDLNLSYRVQQMTSMKVD